MYMVNVKHLMYAILITFKKVKAKSIAGKNKIIKYQGWAMNVPTTHHHWWWLKK